MRELSGAGGPLGAGVDWGTVGGVVMGETRGVSRCTGPRRYGLNDVQGWDWG